MTNELVCTLIKAELIAFWTVVFTWVIGLFPWKYSGCKRCYLLLMNVLILTLTPIFSVLWLLWDRGYLL